MKRAGTLYLLRHGQTDCTIADRLCSRHDPPLNAVGQSMAAAVARYHWPPPWTSIYASPARRARQTAGLIAETSGLSVGTDGDLRELDYGAWDHQLRLEITGSSEYRAWVADPDAHPPPGGERASEVARRASGAIARIEARHPARDVLVVTHKATLRILICHFVGIEVRRFRHRLASPVASLTCIAFRETGPLLVKLADVAHLPREWQANPDFVATVPR